VVAVAVAAAKKGLLCVDRWFVPVIVIIIIIIIIFRSLLDNIGQWKINEIAVVYESVTL